MNFEFSEDQKFLQDQAHKFLTDKCGTDVNRGVLEGEHVYAEELWRAIVELGWTATTIPESYGGLGLGHLELCVIAEELGRAIAPVPFSSSVYLATEALLVAGSEDQKQTYLPKLAAGELIGTFAMAEGPGRLSSNNITTTFIDGKLNGTKLPVPDGDIADFAIVLAKTSGENGDKSAALALVDLNKEGVTRQSVKSLDPSRSQALITLENASAQLLGPEDNGWFHAGQVLDRAAVLIAFEQLGGAEQCLHLAKEYALERRAFGRAIGSYQAIKHKMADMYAGNVLARSNAYYGAWALSTCAPELPLAAATARVSATQAFQLAAEENIHIHGGMGFTWEVDCQLYYRRSKGLGLVLGSEQLWKQRLVSELEQSSA